MAATTVSGTIRDAGNAVRAGVYIYFRLKTTGTDSAATSTVDATRLSAITDASGQFDVTLWDNGDSGVVSVLEITMPSGQTHDVIIPADDTAIDVWDLIENYTVGDADPQLPTNEALFARKASNGSDFASASSARDNLGLTIGTNVQAFSSVLAATTASFTSADETKLDGVEALADVTDATNVVAAGGYVSGGTDVSVADGGTGASTATAARTNLGVEIGADVQAYDADLTTVGAGGSAARDFLSYLIENTIFVAKNGTDTRTGLDDHDIGNPFLTVNAAQSVAVSGDAIMVFAGDYSAETALGGVNGVYYQGMDGATLPAFNVATGITIYGSGLAQSLICNHASAVMNFARMDAVTFIQCYNDGVQTAGNAGTYIECDDGVQTAGNAGTSIECTDGVQTAGNAGTYIQCFDGVQTAGNAGTYIYCGGGVQTAGNAGSYILCDGGEQTITHANFSSTDRPVRLAGSGSLTITGRIESTQSNGVIVDIANSWSGTLNAVDLDLTATTVATDGATKGINYGTSVTGSVQLKNCTIITAKNGTGTAKSIDAPAAQTVYVQGSLNQTHAIDSDITLAGGAAITNTLFTV